MGSNPSVYWMDASNASYYIYIEKKKNESSQMGRTKKNIFKNIKKDSISEFDMNQIFLDFFVH